MPRERPKGSKNKPKVDSVTIKTNVGEIKIESEELPSKEEALESIRNEPVAA